MKREDVVLQFIVSQFPEHARNSMTKDETSALDRNLSKDLGLDSLDIIALHTQLEDEFSCTIPEEMAASLDTMRKLSQFVLDQIS